MAGNKITTVLCRWTLLLLAVNALHGISELIQSRQDFIAPKTTNEVIAEPDYEKAKSQLAVVCFG